MSSIAPVKRFKVRRLIFLVTITTMTICISFWPKAALAVPPLPMTVCGTARLDDANVADGTAVTAWLDGEQRGQTATITYEGASVYCLDVSGPSDWDPPAGPPSSEGEIVGFDIDGNPALQTTAWTSGGLVMLDLTTVSSGQEIALAPGWNLISTAVEPTSPAVRLALGSIDGQYDRVLGDGVLFAPELDEAFNTLAEIHAGLGYYLRTLGPASVQLLIQGVYSAPESPIELRQGWNWIGYLPTVVMPIETALQSIEGLYQCVLSLEEVYCRDQSEFATLHNLEPGKGYLIYMDQAATLTYPATVVATDQSQATQASRTTTCAGVQPTPSLTLIYGYLTVNDSAAPVGTRVEVLTPGDAVAGCFEVTTAGQYGLMHVYGADESADPPIPGFREGETLRFRIDGILVDVGNAPAWHDDRTPHQVDMAVEVEVDVREGFFNYLPVVTSD